MQKISPDKAVEGMVLARPVKRQDGIVLMGEGTELNTFLLQKLRDLEIGRIFVTGHPLDLGEEEKPSIQLEAELDERFRLVGSDPLCREIKEIFKKELNLLKEQKNV